VFKRRTARRREAELPSSDLSLKIVGQVTEAVMDQVAKDGRGIHIDTALAGCAATAGVLLLRAVAGDSLLATLEPGSGVIFEDVNDVGPRLLGLIAMYANAANVEFEPSVGEVPVDHHPHEPLANLVQRIEPAVCRVLDSNGVPEAMWPDYVAVSTVDLAVRAGEVFDRSVFSNIVVSGIVAGSKTVPLR
jgi:hypothetical protein